MKSKLRDDIFLFPDFAPLKNVKMKDLTPSLLLNHQSIRYPQIILATGFHNQACSAWFVKLSGEIVIVQPETKSLARISQLKHAFQT
jgi:hypothetical protein